MRLQPGTFLQGDKYRIIDVLGQGGFGITYLAEQVMAERKVCIKEFFPKEYYKRDEDSHSISLGTQGSAEIMDLYKAKFVKEAKTIAKLDHPNIIHIFDVFTENNTAYYVMEYIEGESLSDVVKRNGSALAEGVAVDYIKQAASALGYIHERKIMHIDVKPANIMLRKEDGRPILIDFGLSKQYDAEGNQTSSTPVGISAGYAPMEQYQQGGVKEFSPETDIYSLGATLYYLVTGCVPPQAADIPEEGIVFPTHISSNIREAIERSMSYWRKDRPNTIKEFLALLDNVEPVVEVLVADDEKTKIVAPQPKVEQPKVQIDREPKPKKRRWWLWLVVLLAAGYGIGKYMQSAGKGFYGFYEVGDYYNRDGKKGVVFEVSDGGRHGKIMSLDETKAPWDLRVHWDANGTKTGANSKSDGKANIDKIMSRSDSEYLYFEAFVWCRNKGKDWYLPAVDELQTIYNNKSAINSTLAEYNAELRDACYWSSTEYDKAAESWAWFVYMYDGNAYDGIKGGNTYVRAVSAF